jgi:SAM-dependent methyltransferase
MALSARLAANARPWIRLSPGQLDARTRVLEKIADGTYRMASVPCFCGDDGTHDVEIAGRDRYGLPVTTVLCERCGLLRSNPRMDADSTARFYQDDYRDLYTGPGQAVDLFASQVTRGRNLVKLLAKLLPTIDTVYEIGCGAGGLLLPFAEAGKTVRGVDLGDEYLDVGRAHGMQLVHGGPDDLLAAAGAPADLVLLLHVLEHYLDLRESLAQTMRLVRPGGLLLVEVPGLASIATGYRGDVLSYLQNAHNFHFDATTLGYVLRACGFEVLVCTDDAMALCRRPEPDELSTQPVLPDRGAARAVLQRLATLERDFAAAHGVRAQPRVP